MSNPNPGCLGALLRLFSPVPKKKPVVKPDSAIRAFLDHPEVSPSPEPEPEVYPYRLRDDFLSPAETSFYQVLKSMLGERLIICPQVSLAGLFFPVGDERQAYQNKIDRKRVDFFALRSQNTQAHFGNRTG